MLLQGAEMKIDFNFDAKEMERRFGLTEKNLAYAAVNAINRTALQVQKQAQDNVKARFVLRQPQFVLRQAAVIKPFASVGQGRPYAEVAVGQKPRLLLSDFEQGGQRDPFVGKNVAVPITGSPARPGFSDQVPGNLRITALGLQPTLNAAQRQQRRSIKGGTAKETRSLRANFTAAAGAGQVWKGRERTYMIPYIGVFQRTGPKKADTVLLYKFMPHPQLKPKLGFLAMAKADGNAWLSDNMERAIIEEMNRARR
jgi:hypothetical protein